MKRTEARMTKPRRLSRAAVLVGVALLGGVAFPVFVFSRGFIAAQAKASFVSGREHFERGQYDAAVRDLRWVVERQPDFGAARYYLGCALYEQGKAQAKAQWTKALADLPAASQYRDKSRQKLAASAKWP